MHIFVSICTVYGFGEQPILLLASGHLCSKLKCKSKFDDGNFYILDATEIYKKDTLY